MAKAFNTGSSHYLTDSLPFSSTESKDCKITVGKVFVMNCPDKSFMFNTKNFIASNNRGTQNYGTSYRLNGVHKRVEKVP